MTAALCPPPSAIRPAEPLVEPAEYLSLMDQLDSILRLLREMLDCHPRLERDIWNRINSVLDERLRLARLAALSPVTHDS